MAHSGTNRAAIDWRARGPEHAGVKVQQTHPHKSQQDMQTSA
jgi:hypothetical protein